MVSAMDAARYLCVSSSWGLTNLALQKILYIAHMFHLGRTDEPLIPEQFEAWDLGPVIPRVYRALKIFGNKPIRDVFMSPNDLEDGVEKNTLTEAAESLSSRTSGELVSITHWDEGAWAEHYVPGARGIVIHNDAIKREYLERARQQT